MLEHLQTRQSSENLQIDCIPVPGLAPPSPGSWFELELKYEILEECKFCTFFLASFGMYFSIEGETKLPKHKEQEESQRSVRVYYISHCRRSCFSTNQIMQILSLITDNKTPL